MNLTLGDTQMIIEAGRKAGLFRNQLAYVLATAYYETAHKMKPVREMGGDGGNGGVGQGYGQVSSNGAAGSTGGLAGMAITDPANYELSGIGQVLGRL